MQDDRVQGFRLSPQQRRLWWLQQASGPAPFRVQVVARIEGPLNGGRWWSAVRRVVAQTEILRTNFQSLAGMALPLQVVREELPPVERELSLNGLAESGRQAALEALLRDEWEAPYTATDDSPLHVALVALEPGAHLLAVTLPSLCADRAAAVSLVRELARAYDAGKAAGPEMQYVDLSEWQNELLEAKETRTGREHWAAVELSWQGDLGCELAAGDPGCFSPASYPVALSPETGDRLDHLSRGTGVPVSSFLLAAWGLLLGRWRGGEGLPLGLACDGRRYQELTNAIGPFARLLPVTLTAAGASLCMAAAQADAAARQALTFQESFDWEKARGVEGGDGAAPHVPWAFRFEDAPESFTLQDLHFTFEAVKDCLERFDLLLAVQRRAGTLTAELHYDRSRFDPADLERLAEQLVTFLDQLLASPETAAAELPLLGPGEQQEIVRDFNDVGAQEPPAAAIHEIFAARAARTPDALAAVDDSLSLTFSELSHRANRLALHLREIGIRPEGRVALCTERSTATVVGLLGILKAGGAYVPLEPGLPRTRLTHMLEEVDAAALVVQRHLAAEMPAGRWPLVCLEDVVAGEGAAEAPTSGTAPENLAYVLFTSGSTGQPKGVAVEHRQLLNYVQAVSERFDFPAGAVFATVTTFAADLGHTMVFPALCGGGCLLVASPEQARDPEALGELFARHPVDCLKVVPSHMAALLGSSRPEQLVPRKHLVLGGEALRPELVQRIRALAPGRRIFNHYGPTETTVGVLTHPCTDELRDGRWNTLPLGRPLANTSVYLLDRRLQPVPAWVPGEVYVGGAGVTRGYLGQPALTADRYVPDHVSGSPGARLYRTGDLGRYLPGAGIEFLGRADHQVKIRGFRIELGEIEATIRKHPAVHDTVVLAREDEPGDRRLAAYVVAAKSSVLSVEELRAELARHLPDYMVPSAFVVLPALPLTSNGKIDRRALPAPQPGREMMEPAAPRTPIEELLAGLWSQVLRRNDFGSHDNFFDLGGHSLLATQLFSRMREVFKADLPLSLLFAAPTVAGLAGKVAAALRAGAGVQAPPLVPVPRQGHLPLSFAQQRHWFLQQIAPGSSLYNLRSTVRLQGPLDTGVLRRALNAVVSRHEVLRTSFPVVEGRPIQAIAPSLELPVPMIDLRHLPEEGRDARARHLLEEERERPFDLARVPLLRVLLLRLADDEHLAVITLHHIIADGWSLGVLVSELTALYSAFAQRRPSPLPPLALQYADFSQWQREWLRDGAEEAHLDYWRQQLTGAPDSLRLPYDFPRPATPSARSRSLPFSLPEPATQGLESLARETGTTLFQVLLAAFQVLLHGLSGQTDIVVGAPIANRNRLETEGLIGCFINALALRGDLSGNPSFLSLVARIRALVLEAHLHEDLPFDRLVEKLNPARGEGQAPFFQVVFSYGAPRQSPVVPELTITPVVVEAESELEAKYDLILLVSPVGGRLDGALTYSTDLFKPVTAARIAARFTALLHGVAARPGATLRELVDDAEEGEKQAALARAKELQQERRRSLPTVERRGVRGA